MDHYPVQECAAICVGNGNNRLSWPQSKMPLYNNEPLIPSKTAKALRRRSGGGKITGISVGIWKLSKF